MQTFLGLIYSDAQVEKLRFWKVFFFSPLPLSLKMRPLFMPAEVLCLCMHSVPRPATTLAWLLSLLPWPTSLAYSLISSCFPCYTQDSRWTHGCERGQLNINLILSLLYVRLQSLSMALRKTNILTPYSHLLFSEPCLRWNCISLRYRHPALLRVTDSPVLSDSCSRNQIIQESQFPGSRELFVFLSAVTPIYDSIWHLVGSQQILVRWKNACQSTLFMQWGGWISWSQSSFLDYPRRVCNISLWCITGEDVEPSHHHTAYEGSHPRSTTNSLCTLNTFFISEIWLSVFGNILELS